MNTMRNSVRLIGHLGGDPDVKVAGKSKLAKFSLATSETYKNDKGERVTETQWHHVICWGKPAEIVEKYLHKGNEVAVEGKLTTRTYEDKEGARKYITEINVRDILLLTKKEK